MVLELGLSSECAVKPAAFQPAGARTPSSLPLADSKGKHSALYQNAMINAFTLAA